MAAVAVGREGRDSRDAASAGREYVAGRIRELGVAYERLTHEVARVWSQVLARSGRGARSGGGEPPMPIRPSVVDLMDEIEQGVLWLLSSACVLLDWSTPPNGSLLIRAVGRGRWAAQRQPSQAPAATLGWRAG
jgi:hypothetical protein